MLVKLFPKVKFEEPITCHHNYVSEETHFGEDPLVTRKGAISAREGEMGIIPGSMGEFSVEDLARQTEGVECRTDQAVLHEIPGAYKDIDQVMDYQRDLVEVVAQLKQIVCVKG